MKAFHLKDLSQIPLQQQTVVFDFDGTILTGDCSEEMFKELMKEDVISSDSLKEIGLMPQEKSLDPLGYYEKLLTLQKNEDYVQAHLWMVRALSGAQLGQVLKASAVAFQNKLIGFEAEVLEVIKICQQKQANCYILSASPQVVVRYLTQFYLNPFLQENGCTPFALENVYGIEMHFDGVTDFSIQDNIIDWQKNYSLKCEQELIFPAPTGEGKSLFIKKHLGITPMLSISDSKTDFPLLRDSENGIFFQVPGSKWYSKTAKNSFSCKQNSDLKS